MSCRWIVTIPSAWPFDAGKLCALKVEYTLHVGIERKTLRMFSKPQQRSNMVTMFLTHVGGHWKEEWKTQFRRIENGHFAYNDEDIGEEMALQYPERSGKRKRDARDKKITSRTSSWIYAFTTSVGTWKCGGTGDLARRIGSYHGDNRLLPGSIVLCKRVLGHYKVMEDILKKSMRQSTLFRLVDGKEWFKPINDVDATKHICEFMHTVDDSDEIVHHTDLYMIKNGGQNR